MLDARRKAYLEAMGIELWSLRGAGVGQPMAEPAADSRVSRNVERSSSRPMTGFRETEHMDSGMRRNDKTPEVPLTQSEPTRSRPVHSDSVPHSPDQPPVFDLPPVDAYDEQEHDDGCESFEQVEDIDSNPVAAMDWDTLAETVAACRNCELCESRTQAVFGVGNPSADLMVIGEAPGADEDRQGEPFVGRAGQLLNAMLAAIGFKREQVYIANILKCRPPDNRNPHLSEMAACQAYLNRQIALVQPRVILSVGGVSAHNLLNTDESVGRLRRQEHCFGAAGIPLRVTYHPAYLLRRPEEKAKAWEDLQKLYCYIRDTS